MRRRSSGLKKFGLGPGPGPGRLNFFGPRPYPDPTGYGSGSGTYPTISDPGPDLDADLEKTISEFILITRFLIYSRDPAHISSFDPIRFS
jgi:hypothetical protein